MVGPDTSVPGSVSSLWCSERHRLMAAAEDEDLALDLDVDTNSATPCT